MRKNKSHTVRSHTLPLLGNAGNIYGFGGMSSMGSTAMGVGASIPYTPFTVGGTTYKRGAWDAADPLYQLAGNNSSAVGDTFSDAGVSMTKAGLQSGNGWVALAGGITKGIGSLINAAFGTSVDEDKLKAAREGTNYLASFNSNAATYDDIVLPNSVAAIQDPYSGGWFKKGWAREKNAALHRYRYLADQWAQRSVDNNMHNIGADQLDNALANYAANGGFLDTLANGDMGAVNYGFMQDYLTMKNRQAESKNSNYGGGYFNTPSYYAFGGDLQAHGGDFGTGLIHVGTGKSHEQNPYGGVQMGTDRNGIPNLVEQDEVIYDDYVFSARIKCDEQTKQKFHIGKKREITYAELAKKLEREVKERPTDPISQAGFKAQMQTLQEQQERQKQEMETQRAREAFEALTPEEKIAAIDQLRSREPEVQQAAMQQGVLPQQETPVEEPMEEQPPVGGTQANVHAEGGFLDWVKKTYGLKDDDEFYNMNLYYRIALENLYNKMQDHKDDKDFTLKSAKSNSLVDTDLWNAIKNKGYGDKKFSDLTGDEWKEVMSDYIDTYKDFYSKHPEMNYATRWNPGFVEQWNTETVEPQTNDAAFVMTEAELEGKEPGVLNQRVGVTPDSIANPNLEITPEDVVTEPVAAKPVVEETPVVLVQPTTERTVEPVAEWQKSSEFTKPVFTPVTQEVPAEKEDGFFNNGNSTQMPEIAVTPANGRIATVRPPKKEEASADTTTKATVTTGQPAPQGGQQPPAQQPLQTRGQYKPVYKSEIPRYVGLFGPATALGMMASGIGKPDYTYLDNAVSSLGDYARASYKPLGNYLPYKPMDIWYEQNRLNANARATDRAILNNASPLGTKTAGLLASGYNNQIASGNLYRQALEYNDNLRKQAAEFNRGTDMTNAAAYSQASQTNATAANAYRQAKAQLALNAALQRLNYDSDWYGSLYGNVNNMFKGISDYGRENAYHNMLSNLAASNVFGTLSPYLAQGVVTSRAKGGKINRKRKRGLTY